MSAIIIIGSTTQAPLAGDKKVRLSQGKGREDPINVTDLDRQRFYITARETGNLDVSSLKTDNRWRTARYLPDPLDAA